MKRSGWAWPVLAGAGWAVAVYATVVRPWHLRWGATEEEVRLFVLRRADHQHFVDDIVGEHEALRAMTLPGEAAWLPAAMRPAADLCPAGQAHRFTRGLALAHLDAARLGSLAASGFLAGDVEAVLMARGIGAFEAPGR